VCQYSNLNLRFIGDAFPALAAIPEKFEQITHFSYVASGGKICTEAFFGTPPTPYRRQSTKTSLLCGLGRRTEDPSRREATVQLRAHGIKVWCCSSAVGNAPYGDPYLRMAIDIIDEDGIFVGKGRLDAVPDQSPFSCVALVICCDNHNGNVKGQPDTTYLLLVQVEKESADNSSKRIGVGRTMDDTHGSHGKALKTHEKDLFLLV
jgi:hypothetical protein